jgi:hypothetical protein
LSVDVLFRRMVQNVQPDEAREQILEFHSLSDFVIGTASANRSLMR